MNLIPKILHLYWDKSPMSWLQTLTVTSFRKYNPDWTINIYVPKQVYNGGPRYIPQYKGKDFFAEAKKVSGVNVVEVDLNEYSINLELHDILRSDILRYNLLYEQGGVWSDFDVLWLKPMGHFHNVEYYGDTPINEVNTVVSLIHETAGGHSIGIMIHAKHDPYVQELINLTKQVKQPYNHEVFGSVMISSKYPTLESLAEFKNLIGVKHETYYPFNIHPPRSTIHKLYSANDLSCINNNVMCVHWYNGHALSKQYVNENGINKACSMTTLLKNEGYI